MDTTLIGKRGENIFFILMTQVCGKGPLFRPWFISDQKDGLDYLVELEGKREYFFFVQVKATTLGYTVNDPRCLQVKCSEETIGRMADSPAPAYLVGIDDPGGMGGQGYILSLNERRPAISSLSTRFPLNCENLMRLRQEVHDFWSQRDMVLRSSYFMEQGES